MNKLLLLFGMALLSLGINAQIRFTMVDPANAEITIQNFGTEAVDIQQYRLCALFEYASLSSANVSVTDGSFNLAAGAAVTINWAASSGFNTTASDLGLYLPMGSFAISANMVDFMQYGDFGQGRENVAEAAGLWVAGTFLEGTGPWMYTGNGSESTIAFWSTVGGAGCTAPDACNYNPIATEEDGSCVFVGFPCDDGNPNTVDVIGAECTCVGIATGCTNQEACNYDPAAIEDDFSCYFIGDVCDDDNVFTENDVYTIDCVCLGSEIAAIPGCTAMEACNYDMAATIDDGSCIFPGEPCDDNNDATLEDAYNLDCVCAGLTLGCTLADACNFDPTAGIEDGTCVLPGDNCDDNDPFTNNDVYGLDCICAGETTQGVEGCTSIEACNYNAEATIDNGTCLLPGEPCDDGNEATVNDLLGGDCVCAGLLEGCTDLGACNFNENAVLDNGTCYFPGDMCDDGNAATENDLYNNDCVCEGGVMQIEGCTATDACNYNPAATIEDGSCQLPGYTCDDNNAQTSDDVWSADCVCAGLLTGCTNADACNYNPDAVNEDFSCVFPTDQCNDGDITTINDAYTADCICVGEDTGLIAGCMEMSACNYDATATIDDGSCIVIGSACDDNDPFTDNDVILSDCTCAGEGPVLINGCTAIEACNYNSEATIEDGSCVFPGEPCDDSNSATSNDTYGIDCICAGETSGCTDPGACNFDPTASIDDASCFFPGDNCDDGNVFTTNDVYNVDCVCLGEEITGVAGCTATEACNYNPEATIEDGSCELPGYPCDDANESTINDVLSIDCVCAGQLAGCTDALACNYNADAIAEDGSCIFPGDTCDDGDVFTANDMVNADCICVGEAIDIIEGCTAAEACNYNAAANFDDGSCQLPGYPCDDNDPNTMGDSYGIDCVCAGMIVGCTDATACNYNPLAAFDDFTCEFPGNPCDDGNPVTLNDFLDNDCNCIGQIIQTLGCTDMDACNYDMSADTDDGSCYFVGDACDDGNANTSNDVYNANCQCEGVVSVEEISAFYSVYPNPTNGILTIAQQEGAAIQMIEVVDITGKRIATFNPNSSTATIEMNSMAAGLYTLNIRSNNEVKSVRVQKN